MKIPYQGKEIEAIEIEPITSDEKWNVYKLSDGELLCTKTILISVFKATNEITPDGKPLYMTKTEIIIKVK